MSTIHYNTKNHETGSSSSGATGTVFNAQLPPSLSCALSLPPCLLFPGFALPLLCNMPLPPRSPLPVSIMWGDTSGKGSEGEPSCAKYCWSAQRPVKIPFVQHAVALRGKSRIAPLGEVNPCVFVKGHPVYHLFRRCNSNTLQPACEGSPPPPRGLQLTALLVLSLSQRDGRQTFFQGGQIN